MTKFQIMRLLPAALLLGALAGSLGGCLGAAPPIPRDHYYRVAVEPASALPVRFPGIISVAPIEADGLLRERPLLFSQSGAREIQQHDYHYWTEAPPHMLQAQLVEYLRRSGAAEAVITPDLRLSADYEVTGRIRRFERLLLGETARVVAELELAMTEVATERLIVVQTYSAQATAADNSVEASVRALDNALGDIFARFLADAGTSNLAQRIGPAGEKKN